MSDHRRLSGYERLLSTEEFWDKMCDVRCVRISMRSCAVGDVLYITYLAPEEKLGFILAKIDEIRESLSPPSWRAVLRARFAAWRVLRRLRARR